MAQRSARRDRLALILDFQSSGAFALRQDLSVAIAEFDLPDKTARRIELPGDNARVVFSASQRAAPSPVLAAM